MSSPRPPGSKIAVYMIDPMALARKLIAEQLDKDGGIEVVGSAATAASAAYKLSSSTPDVVLLDIASSSESETLLLGELLRSLNLPVVYMTGPDGVTSPSLVKQLGIPAELVVTKPTTSRDNVVQLGYQIADAIRRAHRSRPSPLARKELPKEPATDSLKEPVKDASKEPPREPAKSAAALAQMMNEQIIAIGASTGGTEALASLLTAMPAESPGIMIVQHMPAAFVPLFAERLNSICQMEVKLAQTGDQVRSGLVLIAPGERQLKIKSSPHGYIAQVETAPPYGGFCPSVDVLMFSVAKAVGANAIGVILTGMGRDGADGLLAVRNAGGVTLAQDAASSVVFGMPREAYENGAAKELVPLSMMAKRILTHCRRNVKAG